MRRMRRKEPFVAARGDALCGCTPGMPAGCAKKWVYLLCAGKFRELHLCGEDCLSRFETATKHLKGNLGVGAKAYTADGWQKASLQKEPSTGRG